MRTLILFLLIFQLILSGCSPEGSFHASNSKRVTPTDPHITPDNTVIIDPRPTKSVPQPAKHHLGYLQVSNAFLNRQEDRSLLLKAKVTLRDNQHQVRWTRQVELDGNLDFDFKAKLYPVKGDTPGDYQVRARLTCMDTTTCDEAIIDVFVNDTQKVHGAQVYVEMEPAPEIKNEDKNPTTSTAPAQPPTSAPAQPQAPAQIESSPKLAPSQDKAPSRVQSPAKPQTPRADAKPSVPAAPTARPTARVQETRPPVKPESSQNTKEEKPGFLRRLWPFGKKGETDANEEAKSSANSPSVMSEGPAALQAPKVIDQAPAIKPSTETKPSSSKTPELQKTEETSSPRRGFFSRLFGRGKTEALPEYAKNPPPPPQKEENKPGFLRRLWPFGKDEPQAPSKEPAPKVMTQAPASPQSKLDESSSGVTTVTKNDPVRRPPARPAVPTPPAVDRAPTPSTSTPKEETEEDDLEHGEEHDDDEVSEDEERPSLFIGTLHEPTEDLFDRDRPESTPPVGSERPRPRPERPQNTTSPDDLQNANRGSRPRDQVIGKTGCGRGDRGPSCGFLERASDLSALESSGNFVMFNKGRKRFYGSHELVTVVNYLGKYFKSNPSFGPLSVNDLSQRSGGKLQNSSHKSHQNGLDADISYPFNRQQFSAFASYVSSNRATSSFRARETWTVFKTLWDTKYVDRIFVHAAIKRALCQEAQRVGDLKSHEQLLRRIRPESGHDKHFHLRILCSADQPRCRQMAAPPSGSGCNL